MILHYFLDYNVTSPFLIRISRAILHTSKTPQQQVIKVSLHIVPCGEALQQNHMMENLKSVSQTLMQVMFLK